MVVDENWNEIPEDKINNIDDATKEYQKQKAQVSMSNQMRERFCQFIADGYSVKAACFYAGYKDRSNPNSIFPTQYHHDFGRSLLKEPDVVNRLLVLQHNKTLTLDEKVSDITKVLESVVFSDIGQYLRSQNIKKRDGTIITNYYLGVPIQNWDKLSRSVVVNGLDASNKPRFIDKQWAIEKLLQIYGVGKEKATKEIEDINAAFRSAGLAEDTDIFNSMSVHSDCIIDPEIIESSEYTDGEPRF